jgi:hypothetical protein
MKRPIMRGQLKGSNGVALLNAVAVSLFSFGASAPNHPKNELQDQVRFAQ